MAPLPDVPGVIKVVHEGTIDVHPWAVISHWRYVTTSGPLTSSQLEPALAKFVNSWRDNIRPLLGTQCFDQQVVGIDLTTVSSATAVAADGDAGSSGNPILSPEACILVTKTIARRYRGGHPRSYWPGISTQWITHDAGRSIDNDGFHLFQDGMAAYYSDIPPAVTTDGDTNIASFHEVSVSYVSGGARRLVPVVDDILGYRTQQVLATQRRRMHRT